jgi:Ni/Co efflux regulator RcnB
MKLVLVSAAVLVLVGGTAVCAQPAPDHRNQQQSDQRGAQHAPEATAHHWARGQNLPASYRAPSAYVDYKSNHLSRPHTGRRWVKVDNDNFAEMSVKTGHIYQISGHR